MRISPVIHADAREAKKIATGTEIGRMAGSLFQGRGGKELGFLLTALHADRARTFRIEVAGHDGVHPDLPFSEFERQHLGNRIHRGLG